MDQKSKERLDEILRKEAEALSPGDRDFLRSRKSYLSASDLERYKGVLTKPSEGPAEKPPTAKEEKEKQPRK